MQQEEQSCDIAELVAVQDTGREEEQDGVCLGTEVDGCAGPVDDGFGADADGLDPGTSAKGKYLSNNSVFCFSSRIFILAHKTACS